MRETRPNASPPMIGHFMKGMGHPDCCIRYCAKASMQFGVMYDAVKWVQPEGGASKVPVEDWVKGAAAFEQFYQPDDIDKGGSDGLVDEVVAVLGEDYRIAKSMYLAANFYVSGMVGKERAQGVARGRSCGQLSFVLVF